MRVQRAGHVTSADIPPEIAAGAESKIILVGTTTHVKREVTGEAVIRLNDPKQEHIKFALRGTVRPRIDVLPSGAFFLSALRGEETERTLRIVKNEQRPLINYLRCRFQQ